LTVSPLIIREIKHKYFPSEAIKIATLVKNFALTQVPWERSASLPYLQGPATHTTGTGSVLDGVHNPT